MKRAAGSNVGVGLTVFVLRAFAEMAARAGRLIPVNVFRRIPWERIHHEIARPDIALGDHAKLRGLESVDTSGRLSEAAAHKIA